MPIAVCGLALAQMFLLFHLRRRLAIARILTLFLPLMKSGPWGTTK